jgi:hypothetical protein
VIIFDVVRTVKGSVEQIRIRFGTGFCTGSTTRPVISTVKFCGIKEIKIAYKVIYGALQLNCDEVTY